MKTSPGKDSKGRQIWNILKGHIDGTLNINASADSSVEVTPADATVLEFKALYIGVGGTVVIKHTETGAAITYANLPDGFILPVSGVRVMLATTSTSIVAMNW